MQVLFACGNIHAAMAWKAGLVPEPLVQPFLSVLISSDCWLPLRNLHFCFCGRKVMLKSRTRHQLMDNRLSQPTPRLDIRWKMLADKHTVPANAAANGQDGIPLFRKNLRQHQGINSSPGRMSARIAEILFRL